MVPDIARGMTRGRMFRALLGAAALAFHALSFAGEVAVSVAMELELQAFVSNPAGSGRHDDNFAVSLEPDFRGDFDDGNTLWRFVPFGRWDSRDPERRHGDIREMYLLHVMDDWEFLAGVSKVFWGVAESRHLVDIINQTDHLEGIDGEDKLGQPMLSVGRSFGQSTLTFYVLPGFRERAFLSADSPLSLPFAVSDDPLYESGKGRDHMDFAVRFSGYRDVLDYGVSWFRGTSREAGFVPGMDRRLRPFYPQIEQFGLDLQITTESWLWKFEAIRRTFGHRAAGDDFTAAVGGFEYSFYGLRDGLFDLGLLAELHYDSRDDSGTILFQDDVFLGMRFGFTDVEGTEILAGTVIDLKDGSQSLRVEGSRRMFNNARLGLEAQSFFNVDPGNASYGLRNSDYALLSLKWYF